ncbi:unnamed protein product, partial [Closterium sp. NIES-64]
EMFMSMFQDDERGESANGSLQPAATSANTPGQTSRAAPQSAAARAVDRTRSNGSAAAAEARPSTATGGKGRRVADDVKVGQRERRPLVGNGNGSVVQSVANIFRDPNAPVEEPEGRRRRGRGRAGKKEEEDEEEKETRLHMEEYIAIARETERLGVSTMEWNQRKQWETNHIVRHLGVKPPKRMSMNIAATEGYRSVQRKKRLRELEEVGEVVGGGWEEEVASGMIQVKGGNPRDKKSKHRRLGQGTLARLLAEEEEAKEGRPRKARVDWRAEERGLKASDGDYQGGVLHVDPRKWKIGGDGGGRKGGVIGDKDLGGFGGGGRRRGGSGGGKGKKRGSGGKGRGKGKRSRGRR